MPARVVPDARPRPEGGRARRRARAARLAVGAAPAHRRPHRGRHRRRRRRLERAAARASSACCRPATCGWRWPRCAATTPGHHLEPGVQHRFGGDGALAGHAVGNLLLIALLELLGDPVAGPGLGRPAARRGRPGAADGLGAAGHRGRGGWRSTRTDPTETRRSAARSPCAIDRRAGCGRSRCMPADPPACPEAVDAVARGRLGGARARARGSPACCRTCWCPSWRGA